MADSITWTLVCVDCASTFPGDELRYRCACGGTLDVVQSVSPGIERETVDERLRSRHPHDRSGVWRFRELILPGADDAIVTRGEGRTGLHPSKALAAWVGLESIVLKHEGENPTGSFKDRGMTVGVTQAMRLGKRRVACASTGNTSASMAAYAAIAGLEAYVFVPAGKVAFGKLAQALAYGARTLEIEGDFDDAMTLVQELCAVEDVYLLNSINPFRVEGQKAIGFELLQDLEWEVPDWIVLPGGNLGNVTALTKGLGELHALGWIDRLPRVAVIQAAGANPFYTAWTNGAELVPVRAETLATAIRIGAPVSWRKALRGLHATNGVVTQVDDAAIVEAKARVDAAGIGAEPASCATVAGIRRLVAEGVIAKDARVAGILTGHVLKDPGLVVDYHKGELAGIESTLANAPQRVAADLDSLRRAISG